MDLKGRSEQEHTRLVLQIAVALPPSIATAHGSVCVDARPIASSPACFEMMRRITSARRRPSLPGRVAYQLEALLSTRQERMDDSTSVQSGEDAMRVCAVR